MGSSDLKSSASGNAREKRKQAECIGTLAPQHFKIVPNPSNQPSDHDDQDDAKALFGGCYHQHSVSTSMNHRCVYGGGKALIDLTENGPLTSVVLIVHLPPVSYPCSARGQ